MFLCFLVQQTSVRWHNKCCDFLVLLKLCVLFTFLYPTHLHHRSTPYTPPVKCQVVILKECFSRFTVSNNFEELLIDYNIEYNVNFSFSRCSVNDALRYSKLALICGIAYVRFFYECGTWFMFYDVLFCLSPSLHLFLILCLPYLTSKRTLRIGVYFKHEVQSNAKHILWIFLMTLTVT